MSSLYPPPRAVATTAASSASIATSPTKHTDSTEARGLGSKQRGRGNKQQAQQQQAAAASSMLSVRVLGVRDVPRPPPECCTKGPGSVLWTVQVNHGVQQHRTQFVATPDEKKKSEEVGWLIHCSIYACLGSVAISTCVCLFFIKSLPAIIIPAPQHDGARVKLIFCRSPMIMSVMS